MKSVLKVRNARVKVQWVKRERELSVVCIKVMVKASRDIYSRQNGENYRPVARLLVHGGHHDFVRGHLIIFLPVCELSHFISFPPPAPSLKRPTGCHFS